jgi:hypothetical protein
MSNVRPHVLPTEMDQVMFRYPWICKTIAYLIVALSTGCTTLPGDVGKSYSSESGCFIVAWGDLSTSASDRSSAVYFRKLNSDFFGAIGYSSKALSILTDGTPFPDKEGAGAIKVRYLQAGRYVLANPQIQLRTGPVVYTQKPKAQVEIPFEVKAGECVYLGRFLLKPDADEFVWLDRSQADVRAVRGTIPATMKVVEARPTPHSIGGVIVLK